jgi:hypothetical protein
VGTLSEFRAWLRLDLNDPAGSGQRFADGDLDRSVARAVAELSAAWPKVTDTEHTCAAAGRSLDLSGGAYAGLAGVDEVEVPYGEGGSAARYPPALVPFRLSADRTRLLLLTEAAPAAGQVVRVRWTAAHAVTAGSTTVPAELDALVCLGAGGYAMGAFSTPAADNFRYDDGQTVGAVDDSMVPKEWRARAAAALARFREGLGTLAQARARTGRPWVAWGQRQPAPSWPAAGAIGAEP